MIVFKKIRVRNFMSYGNAWTELDLDTHARTLIVGKNGHGKSVLNLDALCFVLFNRAYRSVTKPSLINDLNGKQCEVEIEFESKNSQYTVRRGIKPNIFEIYENGDLLDQSALNLDYQEHLENNILGMNFKMFTQNSVIGSSNYIPFMRLDAKPRRDIIEDLLHIKVFSGMNSILKTRISENKKLISSLESELTLTSDRCRIQKSYIETLTKDNSDKKENLLLEIATLEKEIEDLKVELSLAIADYESDPVEKNDYNERLIACNRGLAISESRIESARKKIKELNEYLICSECNTPIDEIHRSKHILTHEDAIRVAELEKASFKDEIRVLSELVEKNNEKQAKNNEKRQKLGLFEQNLTYKKTQLVSKKQELSKYQVSVSIDNEKATLKELAKTLINVTENKNKALEEKSYLDAAAILLKDNGIKSTIIKQYVPIINGMINSYLSTLDFFVDFEFDENFDETIKARKFSPRKYDSFSEGEKQRIDLAILFTWRKIAIMNNTSNCNILVMDEVFDKSLDSTGVETLLNILTTIDAGTNSFVISHRGEALEDYFDRVITVEKQNNYSVLKYE